MQTFNSFNELNAAQSATPLVSDMSVFNTTDEERKRYDLLVQKNIEIAAKVKKLQEERIAALREATQVQQEINELYEDAHRGYDKEFFMDANALDKAIRKEVITLQNPLYLERLT